MFGVLTLLKQVLSAAQPLLIAVNPDIEGFNCGRLLLTAHALAQQQQQQQQQQQAAVGSAVAAATVLRLLQAL
jgi:hypothetical protein